MYGAGADYVLLPRISSANRLDEIIELALRGETEDLKAQDLADLEERREILD
ncbi:MAG: hypothetical protein V3U74_05405 [Thermodesulfobacteriota bacterium]